MKNISKKTIGLLLVIVLCFSMMPITAMATSIEPMPEASGQLLDELINETAEITDQEPNNESVEEKEITSQPSEEDNSSAVKVEPELVKVVDKPLVQVVYHYYDADQNQNVGSFADYTIVSTHSYNALAMLK